YLLQKFFLNTGSSFVDLNSPCGGAISTLAYDHEGNIFTCDEGRQYDLFKLGTVDMVYSELFETNECQSFIKASVNDCLMCDKCVWKPFCGVCPVCNYADSGNLIPCLSKNERCQILKGQFEFLMDKIIEDKNNEIFLGWIKKNE
ncbi:SPASM domain-containing protein, partial [Candidatus Woesearchaeota archaeon]|nr:SPASM domain-containing protein [Candidatus Woesearchaeota archaeon]